MSSQLTNVGLVSPYRAAVRAKLSQHRNQLYLRSMKLWTLLSVAPKKILFSLKREWVDDIKGGFRGLPHQIEFGSISEESFQKYDIVVPLYLSDVEEARRHSRGHKTAYPLPSAESVRLCDDKFELNQALIKAGFGRYIPKMAALSMPYILKKRVSEWGKGCYIIRSREDEFAQLDRITAPENFCQELIPGSAEFATHILIVQGRIVRALNIKYAFACDSPIKGQNTTLFRVVHRCQYLNLFARMLRTIQFEGLCCVNYKMVKGRPFLLEINPRFGGSLAPYFFSFIRHLQ